MPEPTLSRACYIGPVQGLCHDLMVDGGGGGRQRLFEVDSFHAAPIGIMLKCKILGGHIPPSPSSGVLGPVPTLLLGYLLLKECVLLDRSFFSYILSMYI